MYGKDKITAGVTCRKFFIMKIYKHSVKKIQQQQQKTNKQKNIAVKILKT